MPIFFIGTDEECEQIQSAENSARGYPALMTRVSAGEPAITHRRVWITEHPTIPAAAGKRTYQILDGLAASVAPPGLAQRIANAPELPWPVYEHQPPGLLVENATKR